MKNAIFLQNLLTQNGFKTLAAGGFVRDFLLKISPKDIDLATEATPEEVLKILEANSIRSIETGLKHGTVTAMLDKVPYEITTLRIDKVCKGREAEVEFIKSFEEDAKRRDLTVNALFMDLNNNEIIDYVGGQLDLHDRLLRFVGDPEKRIREDYLRILRLFRFQSKLGFNLDKESHKYSLIYFSYLCFISSERIRDEFLKLLIGDHFNKIHKEFIVTLIPELYPSANYPQNCSYHCHDVLTHTLKGVEYLTQFKNPLLSFAHLFHDVAKPFCHIKDIDGTDHFYGHANESEKVADSVCDRLKFSSKDKKTVKWLIKKHMMINSNLNESGIRRLINHAKEEFDNGEEIIRMLMEIKKADFKGMKEEYWFEAEKTEQIFNFYLEQMKVPIVTSPLNGQEIMALGFQEGTKIGEIKSYLKDMVLDGKLRQDDKNKASQIALEKFQ